MADIYLRESDAPDSQFIVGDIILDIPPENISISQITNNQSLSFLRNRGSLRIPSGRSMLRIDIKCSLNVEENYANLDKISDLVAMTRVTPFVPISNKYVAEHIQAGAESFQSSYPVAIMGIAITPTDAIDIVDCHMSFIFWNSNPFMGLEKLTWDDISKTRENIKFEYERYKAEQDTQLYQYMSANGATIQWNDVKPYSELVEEYNLKTLEKAKEEQKAVEEVAEDSFDSTEKAFADLYRSMKKDYDQTYILNGARFVKDFANLLEKSDKDITIDQILSILSNYKNQKQTPVSDKVITNVIMSRIGSEQNPAYSNTEARAREFGKIYIRYYGRNPSSAPQKNEFGGAGASGGF